MEVKSKKVAFVGRASHVKGKMLGVSIFLIFLMLGCQKTAAITQQGPQIIPVRVEKVKIKDLERKLEYVGSVNPQDQAELFPKVSGKIVEKVKEEGSLVNKGEAIAYIDRDEVGLKFERAPVESPLSGVIGKVYVDIGSNVLVSTPVALVVNIDKVKVTLDIPEIYLPYIHLGQEALVSVDAYPQEAFKGGISKVVPVVSPENRAAPIEITLNNPKHLLKSGMFVNVSIAIEKHEQVPVILKESIIGKYPDTYVYVIENEKAVLRKISLGIHDGPVFEVTEGLKDGELVVVVGQQRLHEGAQVSVEMSNGNNGGSK